MPQSTQMRTATASIDVPPERYWPTGWAQPEQGLPQFRGTEPTPGHAGMEVLQDGDWTPLPSQAALHIRVLTMHVAYLRRENVDLSHHYKHHREAGERLHAQLCESLEEVDRLRAALAEVDRIGGAAEEHNLWLIIGNMQGEAVRALQHKE